VTTIISFATRTRFYMSGKSKRGCKEKSICVVPARNGKAPTSAARALNNATETNVAARGRRQAAAATTATAVSEDFTEVDFE